MSHALRPGTVTRDYAVSGGMIHRRSDRVERFHTVARRIAEGNHIGGATLVRHSGTFPPHRDGEIDLDAGDNPNEWNVYFNGLPRRESVTTSIRLGGSFVARPTISSFGNLETIPHVRGFAPMVMTAKPTIGIILGGLTDTGRIRWHD
jgi:hypothetical protein